MAAVPPVTRPLVAWSTDPMGPDDVGQRYRAMVLGLPVTVTQTSHYVSWRVTGRLEGCMVAATDWIWTTGEQALDQVKSVAVRAARRLHAAGVRPNPGPSPLELAERRGLMSDDPAVRSAARHRVGTAEVRAITSISRGGSAATAGRPS